MSQAGGRHRRLHVEEDVNGVTIVSFADRKILDEAVIQQLGEELLALADGHPKILLNFGNVEYLSSGALGKLITAHKAVQAAGGKMRLCRIHPQIYEIFKITKLNKLFEIFPDEQSALQGF